MGQHWFKNDSNFGNIMNPMHNGNLTDDDISCLNMHVVGGNHPNSPKLTDLPTNLKYAIYRNKN
jgi:hypothetical protein